MKTTIQILYDKSLFDNFQIADKVLKDFLLTTRRRPDLEDVDDVIQCFVHKYKLKNKATSIIEIYQVLSSLSSQTVGIYLRDGPFSSDIGIVKLHPSKALIGLQT